MEEFLAGLDGAANCTLGSLGTSPRGHDLPWLLFTAEGLDSLAAARAIERPVVWCIGLQHGNEPAGGEGALALAHRLAAPPAGGGDLARLLDDVTVVIVPRLNPDGAAAFTRDTAAGMDANRDHILLSLPEVAALHAAAAELPPHVVLDLHEFGVAGRWPEKFGGIQAVDFMWMRATHPLVPPHATRLNEELLLPAIRQATRALGLTDHIYFTTATNDPDPTVATGGNASGISRNAFGLLGAASILLETRGVGIGADAFPRRVGTHVLAAEGLLRAVAGNARRVLGDIAAGRAAAAASREDLVVAHRVPIAPRTIPLLDPVTGEDKPVEVAFRDARRIEPTVVAPRPAGYALHGQGQSVLPGLVARGLDTCALPAGMPLDAESFAVTSHGQVDRRAINPDATLTATAARATLATPSGARFLPLRQEAAGVVVAALDPAAPGSFPGVGLIVPDAAGRLPLWRLPAGNGSPEACPVT
jgi:hypothetical protein